MTPFVHDAFKCSNQMQIKLFVILEIFPIVEDILLWLPALYVKWDILFQLLTLQNVKIKSQCVKFTVLKLDVFNVCKEQSHQLILQNV